MQSTLIVEAVHEILPVLDSLPSGGAPGAECGGSASPGRLLLCSENCHCQDRDGREEVWGISSSPASSVWQGGEQKLNEEESGETNSTPPLPP